MTRRDALVGLAALGLTGSALAAEPDATKPRMFGERVQRTMQRLANSTREKRNRVKILFYGQSISEQEWSREVSADLRKRFPNADLIIENKAIGGFSADRLKRTVASDVWSFYPDLILFHDYGGDSDYEEIIHGIRANTTAEMILQSDHVAGNLADTRAQNWHDKHSFEDMPRWADKYGCEMAEIRRPWRRYLQDNKLAAAALLVDGVHLNEQGNHVLANLILRHLVVLPLKTPTDHDTVREYTVGKEVDWKNGTLTLPFTGNRVEIIADTAKLGLPSVATVQIDGKKPSGWNLYSITRPSPTLGVGWPAILHIGHEKPLIAEEWTATITKINDAADDFSFEVMGSVTGKDGTGNAKERFVSQSGRVIIEPTDWYLKQSRDFSKVVPQAGFTVHWQAVSQYQDTFAPVRLLDMASENSVVVAQGLPNTAHTLTLTHSAGNAPAVKAIRIYRPPVM